MIANSVFLRTGDRAMAVVRLDRHAPTPKTRATMAFKSPKTCA
jgi:hypothetical protein